MGIWKAQRNKNTEGNGSMIRITRKRAYMSSFSSYKIYIDGIYRGKIEDGETEEFEVSNGKHIVYVKISWCRSNKLCITVNDSVVELEVGTSLTGWRILLIRLYVTFWRYKYLWIREKEKLEIDPEAKNSPLCDWL